MPTSSSWSSTPAGHGQRKTNGSRCGVPTRSASTTKSTSRSSTAPIPLPKRDSVSPDSPPARLPARESMLFWLPLPLGWSPSPPPLARPFPFTELQVSQLRTMREAVAQGNIEAAQTPDVSLRIPRSIGFFSPRWLTFFTRRRSARSGAERSEGLHPWAEIPVPQTPCSLSPRSLASPPDS